jgi:protein O-GlcNAc transferase
VALRAYGDLDGAIASYRQAIAIDRNSAAAHANLGNAMAARTEREVENTGGDVMDHAPSADALAAQARAVALDPKNPVLHRNHGILLVRARQRMEAAQAFINALTCDVTDVESCLRLGHCLRAAGHSKTAQAGYEKWLAANPADASPSPPGGVAAAQATRLAARAPVMRALAGLLTRDGQVDAALAWAQQAAAIDPDPYALMQIGSTLMQSRRLEEALTTFQHAVATSNPDRSADIFPPLLLGLTYLHDDPQIVFDGHAEFGQRLADQLTGSLAVAAATSVPAAVASLSDLATPLSAWHPLESGQRLKVGYVSGDFVRHSVSYFIGPLLEHHDKNAFEVTCYHNLGWGDAVTERLKSYGHRWVECEGLSHAHLRRRIAADGIDILIDLSGHTAHTRVPMFAMRAAPVQMAYLGYPTISGVQATDFRITDAVIDPGDMPPLASEQPLCLPHTMFCYRPDAEAPPVAPPPVLHNGHITFGSFNNIAKVTDHTLALWAAALNAVPGSRLLLKSTAMAQASNRDNITRFMAQHGVAADRLDLLARIDNKGDHLGLYHQVDIALDTFPYNGATTTCEALWMGVPVVTRRGRTHTSRMGASILGAIGQTGWVTNTDAGYVAAIARLAGDVDALAQWRMNARATLAASALLDEVGFTNRFEVTLRQAWALSGARLGNRG